MSYDIHLFLKVTYLLLFSWLNGRDSPRKVLSFHVPFLFIHTYKYAILFSIST